MKRTLLSSLAILILLFAFLTGCRQEVEGTIPDVHLIPKPVKSTVSADVFELIGGRVAAPAELSFEANYLIELLNRKTGVDMAVENGENPTAPIRLILDPSMKEEEAYTLDVTTTQITMQAKTATGIFYAIQTFRQLLPFKRPGKNEVLTIPCISVKDNPRFAYRGMHLDVSRHFFDVTVVKRYLDMMARYKLNHFHWHLTDDQGWRVQIDAYPKLTTISSWRDETLKGHYDETPWKYDGARHGGYYTKDQIREIVSYAEERHITIVPEIEMPGHAQAILAAYPEFGCTGNNIEVRREWGISEDVLCPKEETFRFLEAVLTEVIDLFPGRYIHIGGDECPKTQWNASDYCRELMQREGIPDAENLQSWFVKRIEKFINSKGRVMIGWDEILEGGLAPNAVVMSWRGMEGGIEAAKQAHDVIMTPTSHVYLDYYQSTHPEEPLAIGGYLPISQVYSLEPIPAELTPEQQKHILGAQANVWTEYIETPLKLDYMAWPRGMALAEVVWSPADQRDFTGFAQRLIVHLDVLRSEGIYAANHLYDLDYQTRIENGQLFLAFEKILPDIIVNYSIDGEKSWQPIATALKIDSSMTVIARSEGSRSFQGRPLTVVLDKHLAAGKSITLVDTPAPQYNNGGIQSLVNGIKGSDVRYGDKEWRGFSGKDLDATIDLGSVMTVSGIETRCFEGQGQWIYLPVKTEISFSIDGTTYTTIGEMGKTGEAGKVHSYRLQATPTDARYVRVHMTNYGRIPDGNQGAGHDAWLFVDELVIR